MILTHISSEFFIIIGAQTIGKGNEAKQEGTKSFTRHQTHIWMYTKWIGHLKHFKTSKVKIDTNDQTMD